MANILFLNQPYVSVGLSTYTFTIPSTGLYTVSFSSTVPQAYPTGNGAGSGEGLGSGRGGGDQYGFAKGGGGLGTGSEGQGFGPDNSGYQQPPAAASNATSGPSVESSLVVLVKQNGSTVLTAPAIAAPGQSSLNFKLALNCTTSDTIEIDMSSSNADDTALNSLKSTAAIDQGLN